MSFLYFGPTCKCFFIYLFIHIKEENMQLEMKRSNTKYF